MNSIHDLKYLSIVYPDNKNIVGTPGGLLFSTDALRSLDIDPKSDFKDNSTYEFLGFRFSGITLKDIVNYYDFLINNGAILVCMDPRIKGLDNIEQSTMHVECGAADAFSSKFYEVLDDNTRKSILSENNVDLSGKYIEDTICTQLDRSKLPIHQKAKGAHRDSGILIFIGGRNGIIGDEIKAHMLDSELGGFYHIGLNINLIEKFLNKYHREDVSRQKKFIKGLVNLNLGVALTIASSDHNKFNIEKGGFHVVLVDGKKAQDDELGLYLLKQINLSIAEFDKALTVKIKGAFKTSIHNINSDE